MSEVEAKTKLDLTKPKDVEILLLGSTSEMDWNQKVNQVLAANNGQYPFWWFDQYFGMKLGQRAEANWVNKS